MCTLIVFHRVFDDAPLALAVNRDEEYARPSAPPGWWEERDPPLLAPRDERGGGTWMGANPHGVWVGVTNRHAGEVDPGRRSRGLLCLDLLEVASAERAVHRIASLERPYNPFHLVSGDGKEAWLVEYEGGEADARRLGEGVHVITNRPPKEAEEEPKAKRAWALLGEAGLWPLPLGGAAPPDLEERLGAILADHGREGADAICLHGGRYGTRSAAVWRIRPPEGDEEAGIRLEFADGPPCTARFETVYGVE
ncbi:MAG: NRDE family protein [Gemmatimonadota bacterium]|nr:NRDE family protein [Gemmatimonadota bacterium]